MQTPLDELYDQYNRFTPDAEIQKEIEACHQALIRSLEKPERKLVLRIIDSKDLICGIRAKRALPADFGWHGGYAHNCILTITAVHLRKPSRRAVVLLCGKEMSRMKHKSKTVLGAVGLAAVLLLTGSIPHHLPVKAPAAPYSRPVYGLRRGAEAVSLSTPQADCMADVPAIAEDISGVSDTAADPPCSQGAPEPEAEPAADTVPQEVSPTAPARQEQHPKESTPEMGDTRVVDGKKQGYCLGFGWIDDNGGGAVVDGDGDINKMVGNMG